MKKQSFFKCKRNDLAREIAGKPGVLAILYRLAMFTPREGTEEQKWILLKWRDLGLTQQQFRDARDFVERNEQGTFRGTSRGTYGKLISKSIFDINAEHENEHENEQRTSLYIQEGNKKSKQERKYIKESENFSGSLSEPENSEPLQSSEKVSPLWEQACKAAAECGIQLVEVGIGFKKLEEQFDANAILKKVVIASCWLVDKKPKEKRLTTARLRMFLEDTPRPGQANWTVSAKQTEVKHSSQLPVNVIDKLQSTVDVNAPKIEVEEAYLRFRDLTLDAINYAKAQLGIEVEERGISPIFLQTMLKDVDLQCLTHDDLVGCCTKTLKESMDVYAKDRVRVSQVKFELARYSKHLKALSLVRKGVQVA